MSTETKWRLKVYPPALLSVLILAVIFVAATSSPGDPVVGGRFGGDLPAFYGAGKIVASGHPGDLYDQDTQIAAEAGLINGGYLSFAYPPQVALVYAPLSRLPFRTAYVIHTALMAAALVAALWLLRPMVGAVDQWFMLSVALAVSFAPMLDAVIGGQNTAVSLLLLVWIWRSLRSGNETWAGIAVALWMFRPQYAVPLTGLLLVGRYYRAVVVVAAGTAATWVLNAVVFGPAWVTDWLGSAAGFLAKDAEVNGSHSVGVVGALQAAFGVDSVMVLATGVLVTAVGVAVLLWFWSRQQVPLDLLMGLTAAGIVVISPHTMFYDAGIVILTLAVLAGRDLLDWKALAGLMAVAAVSRIADMSPISLMAPVVLLLFAYMVPVTALPGGRSTRRPNHHNKEEIEL